MIRFDSEYAAHMTTGLWKAKGNVRLVESAQRALAAARQVAEVAFMHVKGHVGVRGNVEADRLANRGRLRSHTSEMAWRDAAGVECSIEFGEPIAARDGAGQLVKNAEKSASKRKVKASSGRKKSSAKKRR